MRSFIYLLFTVLISLPFINADVTTTKPSITSITGCRGQLQQCQPQLAITLAGPTFIKPPDEWDTDSPPFQVQLSVRSPGITQTIYVCHNTQYGRVPLTIICLLPAVDPALVDREFSVRVVDQTVTNSDQSFDEASDWVLALSYSSLTPAIDQHHTIAELEAINRTISHSLYYWQVAAVVLSLTLILLVVAGLVRAGYHKVILSSNEAPEQSLLDDNIPFPRASHQISKPRTNPSPFAPIMPPLRKPVRSSRSASAKRAVASLSQSLPISQPINQPFHPSTNRSINQSTHRSSALVFAPPPPVVRAYPQAFSLQSQVTPTSY